MSLSHEDPIKKPSKILFLFASEKLQVGKIVLIEHENLLDPDVETSLRFHGNRFCDKKLTIVWQASIFVFRNSFQK